MDDLLGRTLHFSAYEVAAVAVAGPLGDLQGRNNVTLHMIRLTGNFSAVQTTSSCFQS